VEVCRRLVAGQLTDQVFGIADRHEQADQALEAMFLAHIGFIARHPGIPRLMLGELQKPGNQPAKRIVRQTLALYRQKIVALLNLGIEQKCIRHGSRCGALHWCHSGPGGSGHGGRRHCLHRTDRPRIFKLFSASFRESAHDPKE